MTSLKKFLFGTKDKIKKKTTITPEQEELKKLINEGLISGSGPLSDIFGSFNEKEFQEGVANPAMKHFRESILPQLQEKFVANGQSFGSGHQNAELKAGSDLQSQLSQLMYQAQQQQKQNKIAGVQTALAGKDFENIIKPGTSGALPAFAQGALKAASNVAGAAIAG
jgi:hypothetical protein